MKYTAQHGCDKTMDGKMALYREYCFPNCTKSWQISSFYRFKGDDRPNHHPLDPPLLTDSLQSVLSMKHMWLKWKNWSFPSRLTFFI